MIKKKCKICGKSFATKNKKRKYCGKSCSSVAKERIVAGKGQLCWQCQRATGRCSWSSSFKPIEGWRAKATKIKDGDGEIVHSYRIMQCPQFIHE